jgi:hypothetical protein
MQSKTKLAAVWDTYGGCLRAQDGPTVNEYRGDPVAYLNAMTERKVRLSRIDLRELEP